MTSGDGIGSAPGSFVAICAFAGKAETSARARRSGATCGLESELRYRVTSKRVGELVAQRKAGIEASILSRIF